MGNSSAQGGTMVHDGPPTPESNVVEQPTSTATPPPAASSSRGTTRTATEPPSEAPSKKKRKKPELPKEIRDYRLRDVHKFTIADEVDKSQKAAAADDDSNARVIYAAVQGLKYDDADGKEQVFDVKKLSLDQLRILCRNMSIKGSSRLTLFKCRRALAGVSKNLALSDTVEDLRRGASERKRNAVLRLINAVFSPEFFHRLRTINDSKERSDIEMGRTIKRFWVDVVEHVNHLPERNDDVDEVLGEVDSASVNTGDSGLIFPPVSTIQGNPTTGRTRAATVTTPPATPIVTRTPPNAMAAIQPSPEDDVDEDAFILEMLDYVSGDDKDDNMCNEVALLSEEVDLRDFDRISTSVAQEKLRLLFKVRRKVHELKSVSGTHESDPYKFSEASIKKVRAVGLKTLECYYFHDEFNAAFSADMPLVLKGNTIDLSGSVNTSTLTNTENKNGNAELANALKAIDMVGQKMAAFMNATQKYHDIVSKRDEEMLSVTKEWQDKQTKQGADMKNKTSVKRSCFKSRRKRKHVKQRMR